MIRSLIIDDELQSRKTLRKLINRFTTNVDIVGEAYDVTSGVNAIKSTKAQLVFLDISMPDGSGFDALKKCDNENFEVIFTTAYEEYAINALRSNAIDYLLKPINIQELKCATEKAFEAISSKANADKNIDSKHYITKNIGIATISGHEFIERDDIIYIGAKGGYSEINCINGKKFLSSRNLRYYENILPKAEFFRSHHSYIVNLSHIKYFNKSDGGYIIMTDDTFALLSRRKKKLFFEKLSI